MDGSSVCSSSSARMRCTASPAWASHVRLAFPTGFSKLSLLRHCLVRGAAVLSIIKPEIS